jgi:hypothetical protein
MTDYRDLSEWEKQKVDKMIVETVEPGHRINKHNGFEWDEPEYTLQGVHSGYNCAICLMSYYTCLCSHE